DGRKRIGFRPAHAIEAGERAVAEPHGLEEGYHAVDGVHERVRRVATAGNVTLPQRHEVEQDFDRRARIAADVPAVAQDLAVELVTEPALHPPELAVMARNAEIREHERCKRKETVVACGRVAP